MKLTSLSKPIRMIALLAIPSILIIPNITKMAQAQIQSSAAELAREKACYRTLKEYGETVGAQTFYDDFRGLILTEKQKKVYDTLHAQKDAKQVAIYKQSVSVADPSAILSFLSRPDVSIPPDIQTAIQQVLNGNPKMDQEKALNQRFGNGKYGLFIGSYITYVTPKQEAQLAQISKDFYSQVTNLMTPAQLPQYRKNLAGRLKINAVCDIKGPISSYPALGKIIDKIPGVN